MSRPKSLNKNQDLSRFIKIYQDLSRFIKIHQDLSRFIKIRQDSSRFIKIYQDLSRFIKIYQDLSRFIKIYQIYQDLSRFFLLNLSIISQSLSRKYWFYKWLEWDFKFSTIFLYILCFNIGFKMGKVNKIVWEIKKKQKLKSPKSIDKSWLVSTILITCGNLNLAKSGLKKSQF